MNIAILTLFLLSFSGVALAASKHPLKLIVNGKDAGILPFPPTGDWKKWGDLTSPVTLTKGENKITLQMNGASGGNIDHLQVVEPWFRVGSWRSPGNNPCSR